MKEGGVEGREGAGEGETEREIRGVDKVHLAVPSHPKYLGQCLASAGRSCKSG